jgi:hypothetical protein
MSKKATENYCYDDKEEEEEEEEEIGSVHHSPFLH